jgi:hypothetical protein
MSSISVVVFRHGKVQPNATVQLDGPGGRKKQTTNGAGAVMFGGLGPGKYWVNAGLPGEFLGTGYWHLTPGGFGVIHIKYPQQRVDPKVDKTSLVVSVYWIGSGSLESRLVESALVRLAGPKSTWGTATSGKAHFSDPVPGEYSISASAKEPTGFGFASGAARKRVRAGADNSVRIFLLPPAPPPEPCKTDYEVQAKIAALEAEILRAEVEVTIEQNLADRYKEEGKYLRIKPEEVEEGETGAGIGSNIAAWIHQRAADRLRMEIRKKRAIVEAMKAGRKCP